MMTGTGLNYVPADSIGNLLEPVTKSPGPSSKCNYECGPNPVAPKAIATASALGHPVDE